ncbi:MAG: hypothetical protein JKX97_01060 [Candidatus Lindowbacteria bacterium]|nr:hypothetical protein [Candidatus Lindowbacteria bacterium]
MRDSENDVEVIDGKQFLAPSVEPLFFCSVLALRAMSNSARVVCDLFMMTLVAPVQVAA